MSKDIEIKRELKKLQKIFADIPEDKRDLVDGLIENAAFMVVTLRDLAADVAENGPVITAVNGNGFEVTQENPAQRSYNSMVQKYTAVMKELNTYLPTTRAQEVAQAGDLLKAFVMAGKPQ